ncbi:hypothetical protein [Paenibacillus rigui]|uniref:hypothetical protein n=1 Tax=Paenibacillus rigui TaxID=554312 RepID=UPI001FEBAF8A|nr:hypothetical protein [Paenibacillus rigui]
MKLLKRWLAEQQGAISLYFVLILVPIFLFCALLIDFSRIKVAEKEAENAVKTGVRSSLSAFSPSLHAYGLYGLTEELDTSNKLFLETVDGNMSASVRNNTFQYIDQRLEKDSSSLTPMYSLANHTVFKKQVLEEMKYRAPLAYSLEIADKFKKTGLAFTMDQGSRFAERSAQVEALLDQRDTQLDLAWKEWTAIHQKATAIHPFYQRQLADLNELSGKIGIHTVDETKQALKDADQQLKELKADIKDVKKDIRSLVSAGSNASNTLDRLYETKDRLEEQAADVQSKISDLEQLLDDLIKYAELLAMLKLKSTSDASELKELLNKFDTALNEAKSVNDKLNAELKANSTGADYAANKVFQAIPLMSRQELDDYGSKAASAVALFTGLQAQLSRVIFFDSQSYRNADDTIQAFARQADELFAAQGTKEAARTQHAAQVAKAKQEQRAKAQPALDQVTRALNNCSLISSSDPFDALYKELQGDPSSGSKGYYQTYMELNQGKDLAQPVPNLDFDNADKAGFSAMKLISSFSDLLVDVRDEFYVDEFAVSKFSYRTLGLEKDRNGKLRTSNEPSQPETHALVKQELEYLLYGSSSCAGNYSKAYAEMFAFRLAIRTAEALLEPRNEALNVGSPLLVFLAAVSEGAIRAQLDMTKLVAGEAVPLSSKFGDLLDLNYKDYLRIFFLLHSRDQVLLARMQSLIQLNTGVELQQGSTYVSGTSTTSVKLWFLPGIMRILGETGLHRCQVKAGRCYLTKTGVMAY